MNIRKVCHNSYHFSVTYGLFIASIKVLRVTHLLSLTGFAFFKLVFYFLPGSFCFLLSCKKSYLFTSRKITVL